MAEEAMAEVMIKDLSAPASFKQRLGIGMAMVATTFPNGLTDDEAVAFLDRLFSDEDGYREQALADLNRLLTSNLSYPERKGEAPSVGGHLKEVKKALIKGSAV
jgi:hypothetical protein